MKLKKICALLLALALFPAAPLPVAHAAAPFKVDVKVDKNTVRVGDTITVTWTVSGGVNPDSKLYWRDIWPEDVYFPSTYDGNQGIAKLTVRQGMSPSIKFWINVYEYDDSDHATFYSDENLGVSIVNLDGWQHSNKAFHVQLNSQAVKRGQPITATVTQRFDTGQGTYLGYSYQWYTGSTNLDEEPETALRQIPSGQYQKTFTYTPKAGTHGFLVVSAEIGSAGDGEKTYFYSDNFTILDADTPTCTIHVNKAEVDMGQPLIAEYTMNNHDGSQVAAWWEFVEEGKTISEELDKRFVPPSGKIQKVFDRPGAARFVVDTLYGSFEGTWQEYTPHYWSDWVRVNKVEGVTPLTVTGNMSATQKHYTVSLPVSFEWDIQGGTPPYQVEYFLEGRFKGDSYMAKASSPATITQAAAGGGSASPVMSSYPGPFGQVYVKVTDAMGITEEHIIDFTQDIVEPVYARATAGDGWVELSWEAPVNSTDFLVYQYKDGQFSLLAEDFGALTYRINNLVNGQTYQFLIQVRDYYSYSELHPSFVVSAIPHKPEDKTAGDANNDNAIDAGDLLSIIQFIIGGTDCASMLNADANGDGHVNILDLVWIVDAIAGN
jgi:hypothetical protein